MINAILDAVVDSLKLIPFLFITYLLMGLLERATSDRAKNMIRKAGKAGPIWGGLIGAVPQCGFSAAASYFYVGKVITIGTLIAIYLSTSDEMLPIFISEHVSPITIAKILIAKIIIGIVTGFIVEIFLGWLARRRRIPSDYTGEMGVGCNCAAALLIDTIGKTLKVFIFILLVSVAIGIAIHTIGMGTISKMFTDTPVIGELAAGLIGLIPNCAASVVITQLYLEGIITAGPMMTGLLASAGVGLLVLCRENHNWKQNAMVIVILYAVSVCWGVLIELFGITF